LVLLIGIFLAIVAFVLVVLTIGRQPSTDPNASDPAFRDVNIVVASKDIPLGAEILGDSLTTKSVKERDKPADSYSDTASVIGQTARQKVASGQLITSAILNAGGPITTLDCPATFVCMAVQVDQVSGVGTLTQTGDHVDMLVALTADKFPVVTLNPSDDSVTVVSGVNSTSVKLLLQGMQVVGTLLPPPPADNGTTPSASPGSGTPTTLNGQQQIVILAVTPQQSEVIKYAQVDGSISLVLRSPDDFRDPVTGQPLPPETIIPVTTTGITLKQLVDDYGVLVPELVEAILPAQTSRPKP
jgi:Flp pilus assembly protein CpaB